MNFTRRNTSGEAKWPISWGRSRDPLQRKEELRGQLFSSKGLPRFVNMLDILDGEIRIKENEGGILEGHVEGRSRLIYKLRKRLRLS